MRRFWTQTSPRYRNFQMVFTLLTLNFAIPTLTYVFAPEVAHEQFVTLNALLGGDPYGFPEHASKFWRYLGAANVATLAFMCALLQWNLRRNIAVLTPLVFMKSLAATLWLAGFLSSSDYYPAFLAAAILDYVTSGAFVWFAVRAYRDIDDVDDGELVPKPSPVSALHRDVSDRVLRVALPSDAPLEPRVRAALQRRQGKRLGLGFGIAVWLVTLASFLRYGRTPWSLDAATRDRFVTRLANSPAWWVRQIIDVVKLVAAFAAGTEASRR